MTTPSRSGFVSTLRYDDERAHFIFEIDDVRAGTTAAIQNLGGRKPRGWSGKVQRFLFPPLMLYADRLLRRFPKTTVESSLKSLIEYERWGFPERVAEVDLGTPYVDGLGRPAVITEYDIKYPRLQTWQVDCVQFLRSSPHAGALVGMAPRLGKTVCAVIAAKEMGFKKILVITPMSLLYTWQRLALEWADLEFEVAYGQEPESSMVISNYETVCKTKTVPFGKTSKKLGILAKPFDRAWDLVIVDESIKVKNRDTLRYQAMEKVCRQAHRVWCLSGFPISKYADDLWGQLHLIDPQAFSSYWRFAEMFCQVQINEWNGREIVGTRHDVDIRKELRDVYFSVDSSVGLDEGLLSTDVRYLRLSPAQEAAYESILSDFLAVLDTDVTLSVANRMAQIVRLLEITSNLANVGGRDDSTKADATLELLTDESIQGPVLIWTHWRKGAEALSARLTKAGIAHEFAQGGEPNLDAKIQRYVTGGVGVLILSMGVGKFGHTLTNTRTVIYFDRSFDVDAYNQSWFRVQKIGLDHPVEVILLHCPGTVDDLVADNLAGKTLDLGLLANNQLASILSSLRKEYV